METALNELGVPVLFPAEALASKSLDERCIIMFVERDPRFLILHPRRGKQQSHSYRLSTPPPSPRQVPRAAVARGLVGGTRDNPDATGGASDEDNLRERQPPRAVRHILHKHRPCMCEGAERIRCFFHPSTSLPSLTSSLLLLLLFRLPIGYSSTVFGHCHTRPVPCRVLRPTTLPLSSLCPVV